MKNPQSLAIIHTEDGSPTIRNCELNETYHSTYGAITESRHVYLKHGFEYWLAAHGKKPVQILEVGLGTGLNVVLTLQAACENDNIVGYTALEPYPLPDSVWTALRYEAINPAFFQAVHSSPWHKKIDIHPGFTFTKIHVTLEEAMFESGQFDLVYFDAFAPSKQPDIWRIEWLEKIAQTMRRGAVLVTYCAKGQFKRDLKSIGFRVETLNGPPGKLQMVRATW